MPDWFPPVSTEIGADCLTCYGVGKTPKHYYIMFTGIEVGLTWAAWMGPPPNGLYVVTQHVGLPCFWELIFGPGAFISYNAQPAATRLIFRPHAPVTCFDSNVGIKCLRFHHNDIAVPGGNPFYGGLAYTFTPEEIQRLIEKYTPVVDPDPLFKVEPVAGTQIVISYIDEWGDTKFKMRVDSLP